MSSISFGWSSEVSTLTTTGFLQILNIIHFISVRVRVPTFRYCGQEEIFYLVDQNIRGRILI